MVKGSSYILKAMIDVVNTLMVMDGAVSGGHEAD